MQGGSNCGHGGSMTIWDMRRNIIEREISPLEMQKIRSYQLVTTMRVMMEKMEKEFDPSKVRAIRREAETEGLRTHEEEMGKLVSKIDFTKHEL